MLWYTSITGTCQSDSRRQPLILSSSRIFAPSSQPSKRKVSIVFIYFSLMKSRCTFTTYSKSIKTIQLEKNMINQEKSKSPDIRGVDWHWLNKLRCSTSQLDRHLIPRLRPCLPCSVGACRRQAHSLRDNHRWERLGSSGYHCLQKHWRRQTIHIRTVFI